MKREIGYYKVKRQYQPPEVGYYTCHITCGVEIEFWLLIADQNRYKDFDFESIDEKQIVLTKKRKS
jgi:hypothetical protein